MRPQPGLASHAISTTFSPSLAAAFFPIDCILGRMRAPCTGQDALRLPKLQQSPMTFTPVVARSDHESHLWESTNGLRGAVATADFKTFIFSLLFFKRIGDVRDDECRGDQQRTTGLVAGSYRFEIPEDCHLNGVRTKVTNVGAALQRAKWEIEEANPDTLKACSATMWSNKELPSDALFMGRIERFWDLQSEAK